ncbi:DUF1963 domain-containing protein [Agrobacterium fabrum]|uniref:DUF1963 domain-containing protein n=1 Tax=Agrobacterium fabrum TaxID=1176649 RepID=UPI001572044D|nr:DUF1963 domain-containing protein [Agrobacterium fabrum]WIE28932.1 DUF1963 domain-containing protein [Agrobacterium fabrum]WIE44892.1 DUF1963 domain-containing protein [Agrobacterium fabrum]
MTAFADLLSIQRACNTLNLDTALSRALVSTARPTIWLRHGDPVDDAALTVGVSKVGGEPDLPPGIAWPTRPALADPNGTAKRLRTMLTNRAGGDDVAQCVELIIEHLALETPMAFLAQVNLSVMANEPGFDPSLPDRGMLWAFNDPFADWYGAQSPSGGIALLWSDAGGLERRATPHVVREAWQKGVSDYGFRMSEPWEADVKAEPLTPVSGWSITPRLSRHAYIDLADERFEMKGGGGDQLGGWEKPIQQKMHGEVELICTGKAGSEQAHAEGVLSAGERWRHVLTINAETYLWRLMPTWSDGAMFMFVDESELEARRFDKAVGTSQFT